MITLHFGIDFDGPVSHPFQTGHWFAGPQKLLNWLEHQLGLYGYPERTDYLRIELYRQSLGAVLETRRPFYLQSFETDRFATAAVLLEWRDELLRAGWDFISVADTPTRLADLAAAEHHFQKKYEDPQHKIKARGSADRFQQVRLLAESRQLPLEKAVFYEPEDLQSPDILHFIQILHKQGVPVSFAPLKAQAPGHTALGFFQRRLASEALELEPPPGDASLLILRARRDSDLAQTLAQIRTLNPDFQPLILAPEMDLSLELAQVLENQPAMGILSASLARPALQVLKLAPAFLWEPVDVFKIMEFLTLPLKPFDDGLALELAAVLAEKPGLFSDNWFAAAFGYLDRNPELGQAREAYQFWFDRRRYRSDTTAPKRDALGLYQYLQNWAREAFETGGRKNNALLTLAEQARRMCELLEALPEQRIGFLELERIVRTIYDPSPVQWMEAELHSTAYVHKAGAIAQSVSSLLWWNCLYEQNAPPPDKWRQNERKWLENKGIRLWSTQQAGKLNQYRQLRAVLNTRDQLLLVVPELRDGNPAIPSLLLGDLEACFPYIHAQTFMLDRESDKKRLEPYLKTPAPAYLNARIPARPQALLPIQSLDKIRGAEYETPTNLESLFYYPHKWFFRQKLRFFPLQLLQVQAGPALLGTLAHRFFEELLQLDFYELPKSELYRWVDETAPGLLEKEGATLLLYGREPERNAFLHKVKSAIWSLVSMLRDNRWTVLHTEHPLEGNFLGMPVKGKADLVLQRGAELAIVDLKWSGARKRRELIQNEEDLQLVLYAHMLAPEGPWPHTAYFILEDGKMIARNRQAFQQAIVAGAGNDDHADACTRTLEKMHNTWNWRLEQLREGLLELRTARTAEELENLYAHRLLHALEMKREDARWDDYRTLLEFMG